MRTSFGFLCPFGALATGDRTVEHLREAQQTLVWAAGWLPDEAPFVLRDRSCGAVVDISHRAHVIGVQGESEVTTSTGVASRKVEYALRYDVADEVHTRRSESKASRRSTKLPAPGSTESQAKCDLGAASITWPGGESGSSDLPASGGSESLLILELS